MKIIDMYPEDGVIVMVVHTYKGENRKLFLDNHIDNRMLMKEFCLHLGRTKEESETVRILAESGITKSFEEEALNDLDSMDDIPYDDNDWLGPH